MGKVCTINVPKIFIDAMAKLAGSGRIYESRSEFIRRALWEELREYIGILEDYKTQNIPNDPDPEEEKSEDVIKINDLDEKGEIITREYKIVKKLE